VLIHGTATDYQPEEVITLSVDGKGKEAPVDSAFTLMSWNIGYSGDGAKSNFFYDADGFLTDKGRMVRPPKEYSLEYLDGITRTVKDSFADFYCIQEVDMDSKRSYHINQYDKIGQQHSDFASVFAVNFNSPRVPLPLLQPWECIGKVYGGLGTYCRWKPFEAIRYQYPGQFPWPTRIFNLDRCMSVERFHTVNGHDLVLINSHNSAYDSDGSLKKQEMDYLKKFLLGEYAKGNYVIVAADWNQCPPGFIYDSFMPGKGADYVQLNIPNDYMPQDWHWSFDNQTPSNRKLKDTYEKGKTFVTLIDFFLSSPNIKVEWVKGIQNDFAWSDHQPVRMRVKLLK
jgi:endonuclease/exonuclease/phosphatase family metal-dependent hydrolase